MLWLALEQNKSQFNNFTWQLLEATWCLTNIAAGEPAQTRALLPVLPLLIAHLGGW